MSKRAERRHHYRRLKKRVKYYYRSEWEGPWEDSSLGFIVNSRPDCSCSMCRNPRHSIYECKHTIQERKAFQDSVDDLIMEYYNEKVS